MKKASDKQIRWIIHWLKESDKTLKDYGFDDLDKLTMGDAGRIIGSAKEDISNMGYKNVKEYIKDIKKDKEFHITIPISELTHEEYNLVKIVENNCSMSDTFSLLAYIYKKQVKTNETK